MKDQVCRNVQISDEMKKLLARFDFSTMPKKEESGFFDITPQQICTHPEHNFPSHLVIPQGKGYKHVCPGCGRVIVIHNNIFYLK